MNISHKLVKVQGSGQDQ